MADAISVKSFTKVYSGKLGDSVKAVNDLTFSVNEGEIFGFIGPNGAGKTTTIKTLLGLLFPSSGEVNVLGKPAGDIEVKRQISYLPESPYFYEYMSGEEVLDFYCSLFGMNKAAKKTKIAALLEQVGLAEDGKRSLRQYSKGMQQRIGIAQALINDPKLLLFDEPTSGLDPIAHKDITELILSLKKQGKTVFLSSHQLSDVESVCDRVAIINRGKLIKCGTMDELLLVNFTNITFKNAQPGLTEVLRTLSEKIVDEDGLIKITADSAKVNEILGIACGKSDIVSVIPHRQTLEDLFVEIVREARK